MENRKQNKKQLRDLLSHKGEILTIINKRKKLRLLIQSLASEIVNYDSREDRLFFKDKATEYIIELNALDIELEKVIRLSFELLYVIHNEGLLD